MRMLRITFCGLAGLALILAAAPASADQVILDDLIVDGSICVGLDCVNGESFGFDTLRLKENNLRIKFQDTSSSASFPTNDWQITVNDSSNGGANKFSIDDIDGGRTPFTIEASAPSHSLYVDDGGRIGFGTSTPVTELHVKDGDTPTLRLEQDGSSGFTAQTWDVAGNETNFFIRDATNGSRLPFRIQPSAPTNSIYISNDGDIGMGTTNPGFASIRVQKTNDTFAFLEMGGPECAVTYSHDGGTAPGRAIFNTRPCTAAGADTELNLQVENATVMSIDTGQVDITGNLSITGTCSAGGGACDYVFDPGYELESITEHAALMWENGHLPAVGPTPDDEEIRIDVFQRTAAILEELEKAHIYIEQLHKRLAGVEEALAAETSQ